MENRKSLEVTVDTDSLIVSLSDMKAYLRVTDSAEDDLITSHINAATELAENYIRQGIKTKTRVLRLDRFDGCDGDENIVRMGAGVHMAHKGTVLSGAGSIEIPMGPIQSVTTLNTYDDANASSTLSSAAYSVDLRGWRVYLNDGYSWPTDLRSYEAVEVTYVSGYGSGNVPASIVEAIKAMVSKMYDGCGTALDETARALLAAHRRVDVLGDM